MKYLKESILENYDNYKCKMHKETMITANVNCIKLIMIDLIITIENITYPIKYNILFFKMVKKMYRSQKSTFLFCYTNSIKITDFEKFLDSSIGHSVMSKS